MSDQELMCLASGGRLLVARPYNKRMSHQQCLEASLAAAEVRACTTQGFRRCSIQQGLVRPGAGVADVQGRGCSWP